MTPLSQAHRSDVWLHCLDGVAVKVNPILTAKNPERRKRCERSLIDFLLEYMPQRFFDPNEVHQELIAALRGAILEAGITPVKLARAAPRSIGKTTIIEGCIIWAALYSHRRFSLVISADEPAAARRLASIKNELLTNYAIAQDFPEIILPVKRFEGDPRGAPPAYPWRVDTVRLPNGSFIAARSIDSSLAGTNELGIRPDFVVGDDVETVSSVRSLSETKAIDSRWRLEVCHLHDKHRGCVYTWVCTIRARESISATLTDPAIEPEWRGRRYSALKKAPARQDLWGTFGEFLKPTGKAEPTIATPAEACQALNITPEAFAQLTGGHQKALRFYVLNREAMDAEGETLDALRLPFHMLYHCKFTEGDTVFAAELQNDPLEEKAIDAKCLEVGYLRSRCVEPRAGIVPEWAAFVLCSIDVGEYRLHWEASAWSADSSTSQMISCGIEDTSVDAGGRLRMTDGATQKQLLILEAIEAALSRLRARFAEGWPRVTGQTVTPYLFAVDCGGTAERLAWYETILKFCATAGPAWLPLKGAKWSEGQATRALGRNWICETENNPGRRVDFNADEYKLRALRAYEAPMFDHNSHVIRGARLLNYDTPTEYMIQQTAERYISSFSEARESAKAERVGWFVVLRGRNHWLDTCAQQFVLADIAQFLTVQAQAQLQATPRPKLVPVPQRSAFNEFRRERF